MAIQINGTAGNDDLRGSSASENFQGYAGNDTIWAWEGDDILDGGTGDDYLDGGQDHDVLYGGEGDDKLYGDRNFAINAGNGSDILYGGIGNDYLNGGDGWDILNGDENNDILEGNDGDDSLYGGSGTDNLQGGKGNDILYGQEGDDTLNGGDGDDHLDGDLDGFTRAEGSAKDVIYGGSGNDVIWGGEDNDTLDGGEGSDSIYGEDGDDIIFGGRGVNVPNATDTLDGGSNNDTLTGGISVSLGPKAQTVRENHDVLRGGEGMDFLYGDFTSASDVFGGYEPGNDRLFGGSEDDVLDGGDGADVLEGNEGNDFLFSGPVSSGYINEMTGGEGFDVFGLGSSIRNEDEKEEIDTKEALEQILAFASTVATVSPESFDDVAVSALTAVTGVFNLIAEDNKKSQSNWEDYVVIKDFGVEDVIISPKKLNYGYGEVFDDYNGMLLKVPIKDKEPGAKTDVVAVLDGFNRQGELQRKLVHDEVEVQLRGGEKETWHAYYVSKSENLAWNIRHNESLIIDRTVLGGKKIVGGYYPEWGIYDRNFQVKDVPADKLTHLFYAFAQIDQNGKVALFDPWAAKDKPLAGDNSSQELRGNLNQLRILKEQNPQLKNMLSIGGWSLSGPFSSIAATPESRQAFAKSAVELMTKYRTSDGRPIFDGLDIDWEYPVGGGASLQEVEGLAPSRTNKTVSNSPADKQNYVLLLKALREELNAQASRDSRPASDYQLSIASAAGAGIIPNFDLKGISQYVDFFNVMSYDFHGSTWEPNQTNHQAALYGPDNNDVNSAIQTYVREADSDPNDSFTRSDIVMGAPLYGRAWVGVPSTNDGLLQSANGTGSGTWERGVFDYKDLHNRLQIQPGLYKESWDDVAKVPYIYSPTEGGMFNTYENVQSIGAKTNYIRDNGLGGMFFWELSADLPASHADSLVSKAASALGVAP